MLDVSDDIGPAGAPAEELPGSPSINDGPSTLGSYVVAMLITPSAGRAAEPQWIEMSSQRSTLQTGKDMAIYAQSTPYSRDGRSQ